MKNGIFSFVKKHAIPIAMLIFVSLFFTDIFFLHPDNKMQTRSKACFSDVNQKNLGNIPKLSEIRGPRIDDGAVSISCERSSSPKNALGCQTLPGFMWIFLLAAYLALLIFNLAYGFEKSTHVRWVWEALLTGIFIFGWAYFDRCGSSIWFPLYMIKLGIIVYLMYLHFFQKNRENKKLQ